jgi:hypothetical protein
MAIDSVELIKFAKRRLEAAAPGAEVILFGSRARGEEVRRQPGRVRRQRAPSRGMELREGQVLVAA